jgi:predicted DNA-binding protein
MSLEMRTRLKAASGHVNRIQGRTHGCTEQASNLTLSLLFKTVKEIRERLQAEQRTERSRPFVINEAIRLS